MARVTGETLVHPHVAAAWNLAPESIRPLGTGLINRTWLARERHGPWRVLQQLNPRFPAAVNEDIEAVTAHLAKHGLPTPRLLRTTDGRLCLPDPSGAWRLLTRIEGRVLDAVANPVQAREAGGLLARFHRALDDLDYEFRHVRPPVHEPERHYRNLEQALAAHPDHRLHAKAAALAREIFDAAAALPPLPATAPRVVHGDPKISNLVFAADGDRAVCMLDLDTVGQMRLPYELGDAFRSWCNVATEDDPRGYFSAELFGASVAGYAAAAAGWIRAAEAAVAVAATATIQVELAARFCADVVNERYFGWDGGRFASRGDHNLARARGQLAVHRSLVAQRTALEQLAGIAFENAC